MDMTQNKCCRHGANLRRRRRRRRKILRSIIFSCSIIAVAVFVAVGSRMIRSGDGRTNKYDVEAGNNTYDNAVIENSKISEKNKIQNNQSMLDDIMNSTQYPKQLKDLALKNEEALEFVYDYPAEHVKEHTIDLTEEASMDSVPLFVQWDKRWGYEKYSGNFFAASGCGPTTLSMVVVYLTHNREASPIAVAKYSKEAGYSVDGSGSSWNGVRQIIVFEGLVAKFSQNEDLKEQLKVTGNAVLAECAVKDRIWGIGLSMNDPDRVDRAKWNGQNLLGYALMLVRERVC